MNKKILFFDGDGTLWYPKETKRAKAPHWIYSDEVKKDTYLEHLVLTPYAGTVLQKLQKAGFILVALSTHPHTRKEADAIMKKKIEHFKLGNLFDHVYTARDYPEGKGEEIVAILKILSIPKTQALMVGDSYRYDYRSAKRVGVDAVLIETLYNEAYRQKKNPKTIKSLRDILALIKN
jgi:phosphoglycolate phosphatase-like HAD superfamily hydrolase